MFTKFFKLYALKAATTRTYLQKITEHYVADVTRPKCILSDNGAQFTSPVWKKQLADFAINPLNMKRRLLYLKTQFVSRSKHFSSRL